MDANRNESSGAETRPLRGKTQTASELHPGTAPVQPRPSGVRVWPPRPAPATMPEIDLDASMVDTVEDKTVQVRRPSPAPGPTVEAAPLSPPQIAPIMPQLAPEVWNCPRCEARLIDPAGMGLCPTCGYCRSLEENRDKVPATVRERARAAPAAEPDDFVPRRLVPRWVWVLLIGSVVIVAVSVLAHRNLPEPGRQRTLWSTGQLACGALVMLVAQWWALVRLSPELERVGPLDMLVLSGRLWGRAIQRLPAVRGPVCLGFWGLVLMVTAVTITGGLADWFHPAAHPPGH